jgi:hypothetical protein
VASAIEPSIFAQLFDLCSLRLPAESFYTIYSAAAMRAIKHTQNELALELHQLNRLTYLSAFWDKTVSLNECAYFLTSRHL